MLKVLGLGDNVCDKYLHSGYMYPGGQALNFSVYSKSLGADSSFMGVLGTDEVATHILRTLDELGIEHSRCRRHEGENGYAVVNLVDGDRVFVTSNKGGVQREHPIILDNEDMDYLKQFDLIHTSNNSEFDAQLPHAKQSGVSISYDFSGQWTDRERTSRICPYISFGFLSAGSSSVSEIHEACARFYREGCPIVVATCGSRGALLYDGIRYYSQAPKPVKAVDTLGAGDSFAAAFLLSYIRIRKDAPVRLKEDRAYYEQAISHSLLQGSEFAAKTCLVNGAFGMGIPFSR